MEESMGKDNVIEIYTDGSSLGNPGPGGWAAAMRFKGELKEIGGGFRKTTNNRMELYAILSALKSLKTKKHKTIIFTDSRLIADAINKKWLNSWVEKNWKKANREPVLNQDLWSDLHETLKGFDYEFRWVKAHSGIDLNERCDRISKYHASQEGLPADAAYEESVSSEETEKPPRNDDFGPVAKEIVREGLMKISIELQKNSAGEKRLRITRTDPLENAVVVEELLFDEFFEAIEKIRKTDG